METTKLATKISNRTLNRRTGMTPEDALKKIKGGEEVARKTPKAGPTERKNALKVGTKVRVLGNATRATNRAIKHIRASISVAFYLSSKSDTWESTRNTWS